ncbi:phospholipid phosphatase 1-like isoform X3 [Hermetia illucens]|uniref:phospholipid phosphatase 1-like isoform X3 n=1 Tax=Hermetia illucens TaxID=343691 RepID=UPI0018CC6F25|nr:phospholipid phosphatase 1-like isoform X3 [Hermetia illucens]
MRSRSVEISSEDLNVNMTSNSGIYTISKQEMEGHDNLGHSISQVTIAEDNHSPPGEQPTDTMPLKPRLRIGMKTGLSIDMVIALSAGLWIGLTEFGVVPNYKQGFYCGVDNKIVYKFKGDTISTPMIAISGFIPIIIMYCVELLRYDSEVSKAIKSKKIHYQIMLWTREYFIGFIVKLFIVETLKVTIGELRPHFLDTCKPDAIVNCTRGEYISDYTCTNKNVGIYFISDTTRSFPSGHASIGFYEGVFTAWYLYQRFPKSNSAFLAPFLECLCLTWGFVCGATRVIDHRHHWWDVVTGDILGGIFAVFACAVLCKNFLVKPAIPDHINQNGHASPVSNMSSEAILINTGF